LMMMMLLLLLSFFFCFVIVIVLGIVFVIVLVLVIVIVLVTVVVIVVVVHARGCFDHVWLVVCVCVVVCGTVISIDSQQPSRSRAPSAHPLNNHHTAVTFTILLATATTCQPHSSQGMHCNVIDGMHICLTGVAKKMCEECLT